MRDHTSLKAWQEARFVSLAVLKLSQNHWKPVASAVFAQLQRASLSVQLNIAEGYSFTNSPSFRRHLAVAYGSAVETGELLELISTGEIISEETVAPVIEHCRLSQRLLLGLLKSCKRGSRAGS